MRASWLILSHGGMAAMACALGIVLGAGPFAYPGWLGMHGAAAFFSSAGVGVCLGVLAIGATREVVRRFSWGRALHKALRPAVGRTSNATLLAMALASAVGEELFFRGLLVPLLGVVLSALLFGALHQLRGPGRLAWMALATLMGLLFGTLYAATGSIAGPIVAHALINAANLRFLRDTSPEEARRALGGLLKGQH